MPSSWNVGRETRQPPRLSESLQRGCPRAWRCEPWGCYSGGPGKSQTHPLQPCGSSLATAGAGWDAGREILARDSPQLATLPPPPGLCFSSQVVCKLKTGVRTCMHAHAYVSF